jgi:AraC-like DNA-binding protein/ligand-binding sensor protein
VKDQYYQTLAQLRGVSATLAAFAKATGLEARLLPLNGLAVMRRPRSACGALCNLLLATPPGRAVCRRCVEVLQARVRSNPWPVAAQCFPGMKEVAAPVLADGQPRVMLVCGPVFESSPSDRDFNRLMVCLDAMGIPLDRKQARQAYRQCRFGSRTQLHGVARLVNILAAHLGQCLERCLSSPHGPDSDCVARARRFTQEHLAEQVTSHQAAAAAAVCPQYFCHRFKAATGGTFTEYVCRCRVEKAKQLLATSRLRIGEIAFTCGFQSIPYFNRTFRRYAGLTPKAYRASAAKAG